MYSTDILSLEIFILPNSSFVNMLKSKLVQNLVFGFSLGLIANFAAIVPVWAQRFTVAPMVTIVEAKNGSSKGSISVTNNGKELLRMRVYAEDFTYERKQGFKTIGKHDFSAVPYFQFSPRELNIPPGVTRSVRVSTLLPPNLQKGEYRGVLFVENLKEKDAKQGNENAVVLKARVASIFYISNTGTISDPQVSEFILNDNKLNIVLANKGKQSSYPDINWRIDKNGKEIAKDILKGVLIQSEKEREIELKPKGQPLSLSSGAYNLSGEVITPGKKSSPFSLKITIP